MFYVTYEKYTLESRLSLEREDWGKAWPLVKKFNELSLTEVGKEAKSSFKSVNFHHLLVQFEATFYTLIIAVNIANLRIAT